MDSKDSISLSVLSPEKTVIKTFVSQVELPGASGRFLVLRNHAPLITSLIEGKVVYVSENKPFEISILSGFAEIKDNEIKVCAEIKL